MWQFFSRDSSKDFPYEFEEDSTYPELNGFSLCRGTHKTTKQHVSVFCYNKKQGSPTKYEYAKALLKRLKTLRHPNILTYLDSQENDSSLLIVTERVFPLLFYLDSFEEEKGRNLYISWGLMNIFKAVSFLNQDAKLSHNEVSIDAVYVNRAGEWKLGNVGKTAELEDNGRYLDSLGLGKLIWEVYTSSNCSSLDQLSNISKVPDAVRPIFRDLVSSKAASRPTASVVLERGRKPGGIFKNDLVDAIVFLDEIHIKNKDEINLFFRNILPLLAVMPIHTAEMKILPQVIKAFEYGCDGSSVLPVLFQITKNSSEMLFRRDIVPFLGKLFSSNDRATRSLLLQNIEQYIDKVPTATINESLFPQILNGFMDTNPRIREQTVKAMIHLAPELNDKNLNTELMTHFARLLAKDEQGGIRTNTIVCLTKIGYCLNPQNRRLILMSAFLRSLNDPFPPVRNAGTLGLAVSQQYFALEDVSKKILPSLCVLTLDPDVAVRESVFKTIKGFLGNLEKVSENPELKSEMEAEAMSSKKPTSSWAEWATTAITSKFSLKMDKKPVQDNVSKPKDQMDCTYKTTDSSKLSKRAPIDVPDENTDNGNELNDETVESSLDKMKYLEPDNDTEFSWDGDTWESLEDGTKDSEEATVPTNPVKPSGRKSSNKSEEDRRKQRTGPMKLGTKINQPSWMDG